VALKKNSHHIFFSDAGSPLCQRCKKGKRDCEVDELDAVCVGCKACKYRCDHMGKKNLRTMEVVRPISDLEELVVVVEERKGRK